MILGTIVSASLLFANLALGLLVYRRNPKNATHILVTLLTVAIFIWGIASEVSVNVQTEADTLLWARIVMASAVPVSLLFFLLMYTFPRASLSFSYKALGLIILAGAAGIATALSPYLFIDIRGIGANAAPVPGPGFIVFFATAVVPILLGLYALIRKNMKSVGTTRLQLRYLLLGTITMYLGIFGLIVIPVATAGNAAYTSFAPLFTFPFIAATTYAIVRHRLMDIRAAVARSLSFSFLVGAFFVLYAALVIIVVPYLARVTPVPTEALSAAGALIAVVVARYIQDALRRLTDRFLFQRHIDYHAALVSIGQQLSRTIDIEAIKRIITTAMDNTVRPAKTIVFLQGSDGKEFVPWVASGVKNLRISIPETQPLIQHLRHTAGAIVKDELDVTIEREEKPHHRSELEGVRTALNWLDAAVILPLFVDKGLTGFIVLGNKRSGEPYLREDLDFLNALAPQAATALENARLYRESLEFGQRLEREVKQATHDLEVANRQLRDLDKAKSEFLSIASHQLYTPLTAIRGYLSMLNEGDFGKMNKEQAPIIEILTKSSNRLIELIKNLLDISRIESGRLELNLEEVDLPAMAAELVQDLMPNALTKHLQLEFHHPTQPVKPVIADSQRIRQVMLNFIDNAIKYTPAGRIDVTVTQEGSNIVFAVKDTGKGVTAEEIDRLFTKFTRVGGASRFHTEGTGLGLYVARQIVREHHGDVDVESPGTNHGSTFIMRLPAAGTPHSLKITDKATVVIKAAEAQGREEPKEAPLAAS